MLVLFLALLLIFYFIIKKVFPTIAIIATIFLAFSPFAMQIAMHNIYIELGLIIFLSCLYGVLWMPRYPKLIFLTIFLCILGVYSFQELTHNSPQNGYLFIKELQLSEQRISYSGSTHFAKFLYNPFITTVQFYLQHITQYFEPHEFFFSWSYTPQYINPNLGLFYPFDLIFFLAGIVYLFKKNRLGLYLFILWYFVIIFPVALTNHQPDPIHILPALLSIIIVNAFGFVYLLQLLKKQ